MFPYALVIGFHAYSSGSKSLHNIMYPNYIHLHVITLRLKVDCKPSRHFRIIKGHSRENARNQFYLLENSDEEQVFMKPFAKGLRKSGDVP